MSSHLMVGNGRGWERIGTCAHDSIGHAADAIGISTPDGIIPVGIGGYVDAYSKAQKTFINSGLNGAWLAHTACDARVHKSTGAVLQISRNFTDSKGRKVVARFARTS